MALIGYARVSTTGQNLDAQVDALTEAGCERIFTDKASGKLAARPEWDKALAFLRAGDVLVITKLDRAGRSVRNLIEISDDLRARGIDLRVLWQGIDTTTPSGKLLFHMLAAVAEFERDLIVERTNDGLTAARARGRVGGRRPKLNDRQVALIRSQHAAGATVTDLAATFNVSRPTIYGALEPAEA